MSEVISIQQVVDLRARQLKGEQLSREEIRSVIEFLRQDRATAAASGTKAKAAKSTTVPIDLNSLFAKPKEEQAP